MTARAADGYDIVIVGAGIIGCSIAFQLASRHPGRVALVERDLPGQGSTAKATGGFRHQFATRVNVELSIESIAFLKDFQEHVGIPLDIKRSGYLFVSDDPQRGASMRRNVELQRGLGVNVSVLSPTDIKETVPNMVLDPERSIATYCADDGVASPTDACAGFLAAARQRGVDVLTNRRVTAIDVAKGRAVGIRTESGNIASDVVILASGVWSPAVAETVGVQLPIAPHHRQAFMAVGEAGLPAKVPFTVDLDTGAYFHREGLGLVVGGTDHGDQRGFDDRLDWTLLPKLVEALVRRLPSIETMEIQSGWAGLREMTPDEHGIVGAIPSIPGLFVAAGFSGHGFMHSPAIGRIVAELVLDGHTSHPDIGPLSPSRFDAPTQTAADAQSF